MFNRQIIHENFRYKTNDFNFRLGFAEETTVKRQVLFTRIDHWRNVLVNYCNLQPGQSLAMHFSQNSLDTFAIYFAAIECDINLVSQDADIIIHTLADSELEKLSISSTLNYNYFDLADLRFNGVCEYIQKGTSIVYGISNKKLFDKVQNTELNIQGNVLHTRYTNPTMLLDFFFPAFTKEIYFHFALGYNDPEQGLERIAHVVQKCAIDCICLPSLQAVGIFKEACWKRMVDISDLKIFTYDNGLCESNNNPAIYEDTTLAMVPKRFNVDGVILSDKDTLYFKFNTSVEKAVAEVKIKIINDYLQKNYNQKITKWAYTDTIDIEHDLLVFRNIG
jgi:hypothetical protein